jgi:outer membrane protein assembly factor BamB
LLALRQSDGIRLWDNDYSAAVDRAVVANGVVYAGADGHMMEMLDAKDGINRELEPIVSETFGHAVVTGGRLYVTSGRILDVFSP